MGDFTDGLQLLMPELIPVLDQDQIAAAVRQLAQEISIDYQNRNLVMVAVLKGAFIFLADLVRQLTIPVKIDFLRAASYGSEQCSSGEVRLTKKTEIDITRQDVIVVEDIVDTGLTTACLLDYLTTLEPNSLQVCTLIDKRERRQKDFAVAYAGHVVEKGFLVGYGLDYAEDYRNLPQIFHLKL
jgi:hypoxanthine phosphoribosyltransferase